ncbi:hypothetical protein ANN_11704 [Periplaneta americana]|uniref:Reverse transcriptase domain-containing protein n=1 Tax=Periplaneta americana TaxID=6978 RepID=A0ABQ8T7K0_PERAM|nr:hypothetical protein ANN_11704 [Periplaneta americana]
MSPGSSTENYPAFAHIRLRETPEKTSTSLHDGPVQCIFPEGSLANWECPTEYGERIEPKNRNFEFKVCHDALYAVMWLVDEPRGFNLPTLPQRRIIYVPVKLPSKYGVHSEEYLPIRTIYDESIICQPDRSRLVPVAWQQWSEMGALIPSPAACENTGGVIVGGRIIKCIRFADDMVLLAEEEMILKDMLLELNDNCD